VKIRFSWGREKKKSAKAVCPGKRRRRKKENDCSCDPVQTEEKGEKDYLFFYQRGKKDSATAPRRRTCM